MARDMVKGLSLILADEPTGELDTINAEIIMNILKELNIKERVTIVIVTHNPRAAEFIDKIEMRDGNII